MTAKIIIIGPKDRNRAPKGANVINCTSRAKESIWTQLSPFFSGPCELYDGHTSVNMENAWQYSKVYQHQLAPGKLEPSKAWWKWAKQGWANPKAVRYPMGRGAVPAFSWWKGKAYGYAEARAQIYIPLYAESIRKSQALKVLQQMRKTEKEIYLWDFDGWDHEAQGVSLLQAVLDTQHKMGHAFVVKMMLEWGSRFHLK